MGRGIGNVLASMVGGQALHLVKGSPLHNGFEIWRKFNAEYRPNTDVTTLTLMDEVQRSTPAPDQDFSERLFEWLEQVRKAESARGKALGDDIMTAALLKRCPQDLRNRLAAKAVDLADHFAQTLVEVMSWISA